LEFRHKIWRIVAGVVSEHYERIREMSMRDVFYYVREILVQEYLSKGRITQGDLDYFDKKYEYLRDDFFTKLERDGVIPERPEVKEFARYIDRFGDEHPITRLPREDLSRYNGILFVEKEGAGRSLREVAQLGFIVVPSGGQGGFPQRVVRWVFKQVELPVLVLHDHDTAGDWIARTFYLGSKRTNHLDLKVDKERVVDLGLTEEDVRRLDLPPIPEAPKFRGKRPQRWELSSLEVLGVRYNIRNPLLSFVIAKLVKLGFRLSPTERSRRELATSAIATHIIYSILYPRVRDIVGRALEEVGLDGTAVDLRLESGETPELPREIEEYVRTLSSSLVARVKWISGEDVATQYRSRDDVQLILKLLG